MTFQDFACSPYKLESVFSDDIAVFYNTVLNFAIINFFVR